MAGPRDVVGPKSNPDQQASGLMAEPYTWRPCSVFPNIIAGAGVTKDIFIVRVSEPGWFLRRIFMVTGRVAAGAGSWTITPVLWDGSLLVPLAAATVLPVGAAGRLVVARVPFRLTGTTDLARELAPGVSVGVRFVPAGGVAQFNEVGLQADLYYGG